MKIVGGIMHLGRIDRFVVHHGADVLKPTCRHDQEPPTKGATVSTSTTDWDKVTCQSCIEWRHA